MKALPGITVTLSELIMARPPKNLTGFTPSGRVSTHQWGNNDSVFRGRGMEFAESRVYQAGDDMRNIDWRVTAKTGKTHTKIFQEERERPIQILLDLRTMMHFGTRTRFKSHLAAEVAAQMAWVAHDGGDRLGGLLLTRDGIESFRAARTRRSVLRFLERVSLQTALREKTLNNANESVSNQGQEWSLSMGISRLRKTCRPGTLVFLITDFHDFDEETVKQLKRLAHHAHITCIEINDAMDNALPESGGRLSDGKGVVSLSQMRRKQLDNYALTVSMRKALLARACMSSHCVYHTLYTTDCAKSILQPQKSNAVKKINKK